MGSEAPDCVVVAQKKRWWPTTDGIIIFIIIIGTIDTRGYPAPPGTSLSHGQQWTGVRVYNVDRQKNERKKKGTERQRNRERDSRSCAVGHHIPEVDPIIRDLETVYDVHILYTRVVFTEYRVIGGEYI